MRAFDFGPCTWSGDASGSVIRTSMPAWRAPRWMRAMSNGFRFSDDRRRDDAVRLDLFAAMLNFLRHPCRGRAAIVEGPIKNSIRDVAGRGPAQGTRTQAASSASNTDFGG